MNAPHKPDQPDLSGLPELPDLEARPPFFGTGELYPLPEMSDEEREASWQRFLDAAKAGYMSDGTTMTREEMNERW